MPLPRPAARRFRPATSPRTRCPPEARRLLRREGSDNLWCGPQARPCDIRRLSREKGYYDVFFITPAGEIIYTVEKSLISVPVCAAARSAPAGLPAPSRQHSRRRMTRSSSLPIMSPMRRAMVTRRRFSPAPGAMPMAQSRASSPSSCPPMSSRTRSTGSSARPATSMHSRKMAACAPCCRATRTTRS